MAAATVPAHARRHPMTVVTRARELVAAGWSYEATARMLADEGATVSPHSVSRWADPRRRAVMARREQQRQARNAAAAGARPLGRRNSTADFRLGRMRALRDIGLKDTQIALLMAHDFGDVMSAYLVGRALETGRYRKATR